jgi:hypothetical protein
MFGKLSVALLIAASPALAQEAPPPDPADGGAVAEAPEPAPVEYKTKRVCRSIEVVGSSIPRTTCTTKKIPIKPKSAEADNNVKTDGEPQSQL